MNITLSESTSPPAEDAGGRALPAGVARVRDGVLVAANPDFCELLGYTAEELAGRSTVQVFANAAEAQRVNQTILENLEVHGVAACQTELRCKDGSNIQVALTCVQSPRMPDELTYVIRDVTRSRRVEADSFWQNRELTAFHRISEVMLSGESTQFIFDRIARETSEMTEFPLVAIELCDFERGLMVFRGAHGFPLHEMPSPFAVPMETSLSGRVAHTGEPLVENNLAGRAEFAASLLRRLGVQTFVCVPIKCGGRVVGTLSLAHRARIPVEPRVVKSAGSLANYLAALFDRLQAREAVSRSEAELSTVYDRVPNVLCLFDEKLQIVRANLAALEFAGRSGADTRAMHVDEFFNCQKKAGPGGAGSPTTICVACDLCRALQETLATGRSWRQIRTSMPIVRDGRTVEASLLVSTERIQLGGNVRVLMCLEDITKNIRADEQIRSQAALLDLTGEAIYVRDFSDRVTYWNEGAHRLYGWTPAEVAGRTSNELIPDNSPFESTRAQQAVQQHGEWTGELKHKNRAGRELVIQSRWTLVRAPEGKPTGILVVNTDITQKKQMELQLLRSQRLESIGTLASGLAHDLNNVLAPMMMAVQFIKDYSKDEGLKACFQTLETCSRRGADIIRQVLMFARGVEGERILLNPKHLIREMERIATETFPRSIEIKTSLSKIPCVLLGDATQIQQVLMNLCVNARDAMPQGGVLTIGLDKKELDTAGTAIHPKAKAGTYVVISVKDTGTGIPPELVDKIFDPFFTTKPLGQGTGLGLPTVLGIAESHGGFVQVQTRLGAGTTFSVYLPMAPSEAIGGENHPAPEQSPQGKGELILVVDDEPSIRKLASTILSRSGYRTVTAAEGREGARMFAQHRQDIRLVVSDLMMPQLDGPGMLRGLRQTEPNLKSIIITGLGEENRISEAKAAGANLILNKPFSGDQLLAHVKQLLG